MFLKSCHIFRIDSRLQKMVPVFLDTDLDSATAQQGIQNVQVGVLINAQYRIDSRSCRSFFRGFPFADLDAMQLPPAFMVDMEVLLG